MKKLVSIVIPAYNAEKFIDRSVNSILKQKINSDKIEILVVENGSTDNTSKVIKKIAEKEPCVRLLHSDKGVSNARNMGINLANGKWLIFIDADDILLPNTLNKILEEAEATQSDIYFYGHRNHENRPVCDNGIEEIFTSKNMEKCKIKLLKNPTRYMQVWAKVFKTEFLQTNKLKFKTDLRLSEDSDFCFRSIRVAEKVEFKNKIIYEVLPNPSSATRTFDGNKAKDYVYALEETQKIIGNESQEVKNAYKSYILMHMNIAMVREVFSMNNKDVFLKKYINMKTLIREPIFYKAIDKTDTKECTSFRMLPILCLKLHFGFGAAFIYCIRALQNQLKEKKER